MNQQANITYKTINTQVATQLLLLLASRYLPSRVEVKASQELQSMSKKTRPLSFQVYAASRRRGPSSCYTVHHRPGNIQSFSPPSSFFFCLLLTIVTCHLSLALGGPLPDPAGACSRPQQPSLSHRLASCCLDGHLAGEEDKDDLNDDEDDNHNGYGMLAWHFIRICFSEERLENSILIKLKSYLVIHRTSHPSSALVTCPLLAAFQVSPRPGCTIMIRKHYRLEINNNEI